MSSTETIDVTFTVKNHVFYVVFDYGKEYTFECSADDLEIECRGDSHNEEYWVDSKVMKMIFYPGYDHVVRLLKNTARELWDSLFEKGFILR